MCTHFLKIKFTIKAQGNDCLFILFFFLQLQCCLFSGFLLGNPSHPRDHVCCVIFGKVNATTPTLGQQSSINILYMHSMHVLLCTVTVELKMSAAQPGWKVILCYSEDEQVNKLIFFSDHGKSSRAFVLFLKMYWPLYRVQLESFLCVALLKTSHSALLLALTHATSLIFVTRVWYYLKLLYVAAGSNPYWLCPHTLRHTHTHTHSYWASPFLSVILTIPPPTLPLDTACIDCAKRGISVLYHFWHCAGSPCVSRISVWTLDDFSTTSMLVVALVSGGTLSLLCLNGLNHAYTSSQPLTNFWLIYCLHSRSPQQLPITNMSQTFPKK